MSVKVFNNKSTFLLEAGDGRKMKLPPLGFSEVPEEFTGCLTFKMGVQAGVIQVFGENRQGDQLEKAAHEPPKKGKAAKGDAE